MSVCVCVCVCVCVRVGPVFLTTHCLSFGPVTPVACGVTPPTLKTFPLPRPCMSQNRRRGRNCINTLQEFSAAQQHKLFSYYQKSACLFTIFDIFVNF